MSKQAGRHKSRQAETVRVTRRLDGMAEVRRWVVGETHNHRHRSRPGRFEVRSASSAAVLARVYTGSGHQVLVVYPQPGASPVDLARLLRERFEPYRD